MTEKVVEVSIRFTDIEWNDKLNDAKSEQFATISKKIREAVGSVEYYEIYINYLKLILTGENNHSYLY